MPSPDGSDDFVWICRPREGHQTGIGPSNVSVDGGLKINHRVEDPSLEPLAGQLGEQASTALSYDYEAGVKWKVKRSGRPSQARIFGPL